jgi:hypothetical protein
MLIQMPRIARQLEQCRLFTRAGETPRAPARSRLRAPLMQAR